MSARLTRVSLRALRRYGLRSLRTVNRVSVKAGLAYCILRPAVQDVRPALRMGGAGPQVRTPIYAHRSCNVSSGGCNRNLKTHGPARLNDGEYMQLCTPDTDSPKLHFYFDCMNIQEWRETQE